jgi:hypothetical protein
VGAISSASESHFQRKYLSLNPRLYLNISELFLRKISMFYFTDPFQCGSKVAIVATWRQFKLREKVILIAVFTQKNYSALRTATLHRRKSLNFLLNTVCSKAKW